MHYEILSKIMSIGILTVLAMLGISGFVMINYVKTTMNKLEKIPDIENITIKLNELSTKMEKIINDVQKIFNENKITTILNKNEIKTINERITRIEKDVQNISTGVFNS